VECLEDRRLLAAPTLDSIADAVLLNGIAQTIPLSGITAGENEVQPIRITASSDNPQLVLDSIVTYESPATTGSLLLVPTREVSGKAMVTVTVEDGGQDGDLATNSDNEVFMRVFEVQVLNEVWRQLGEDIDGERSGDGSGYSVSLSSDGQTVAIGAPFNNGIGHVRIYRWIDSAWQQLGSDIDGESSGDLSGTSVSLSADGQTVAIGAPNNSVSGFDSGHVRIYRWIDSAWQQLGSDIDGEIFDRSGESVSLSADGQTVAIGAPDNSVSGFSSGRVRIYRWIDSAWQQLGSDIDGESSGDLSGTSVSLSSDGQTVAIGADGGGNGIGHVRIYRWIDSAWQQLGSDIDGEATEDGSGYSVSLSADGQTVAIGAPYNNGNGFWAGHVRIYRWIDSAWQQLGDDIDGEARADRSGSSVSLSADGQTVAIGAPYNGVSGFDSGHVRIYRWIDSAWQQLGSDIDSERSGDGSGYSVSLSSDGQTVAIGAPFNNGIGHVRIYNLVPANSPPTIDPISDVEILEDAAGQIIELTGISAGPNDFGPVRVEISSDNTALIPTPRLLGDLLHPRGTAGLVEFSTDLYRVVSGSDTFAKIHVRRSLDAVGTASVLFQTLDGTAKHGSDYTRVSQVLTFEDGEFFKEINIPLLVTEAETTKDFLVALSNPSTDAAIGLATSRVYIVDAETNQDTNGKLVELILTARNIEDSLIPKNEAGEIDVPVGKPFDLEIAYDDLRVNQPGEEPTEFGVFQLLTDIAVSQPNVLMPILNETQWLIIDSSVVSESQNNNIQGFEFSIPESPSGVTGGQLTYTASVAEFGGNPVEAITSALEAFGYTSEQFEIENFQNADDDLCHQIYWNGDGFGNVNLPNVSVDVIEVNPATEVPTQTIEYAPFLADGETPNPDAVRFNLNSYSRTFVPSSSNPSGEKVFSSFNVGTFDAATGFDEVGGTTHVDFMLDFGFKPKPQPFDAFSLRVYLKSEVNDFLVSINSGEYEEAVLMFGNDDPVPQDKVLVESVDTNFNGTSQLIINSLEVPDSLSFTPRPDQSGSATITVTAIDSGADGDFSTATDNLRTSRQFLVNVSPSPSQATNDFFDLATESSGSLLITKSALLSNDTLGNGESIDTVTVTTEATSIGGGTITPEGDSFIYTRPADWFSGIDSFQYTLDDGGSISTATVTVLSGLAGNTLTITLEPGRDHDVTLQYAEDKLVMLDHVTEETLLNIPREYVPLNVNVLGAPQNNNRVSFNQLSAALPSDVVTSWGYQGGSARDEISILGSEEQWAWLSSDPLVTDDIAIDLKHFTSLIDSYSMLAIEEVSVQQVDHIEIDDPYLEVGSSRLVIDSSHPVNLPSVTTMSGGVIQAGTPVGLHTSESIVGDGTIDAVFAGGVGSVIQATGDLTLGDASEADGFLTAGRLDVGANVVTLLDSNQAELGSLTTIGGTQEGTIRSNYGFIMNFGDNLEGFGTIETLQGDSGGPLINNGSITGNSLEQPITINARVKGVGSFDNVVMNGDFTPGFSPGLWSSGTVTYTTENRFEIELGGRRAGSEYDWVDHRLAKLGGTLDVRLIDGFKPGLGDLFEVITSELPIDGEFDEILLPRGENGVFIRTSQTSSSITLEAIFDTNATGDEGAGIDYLEIAKSDTNDYQIALRDGESLKVEGNQFRAKVKGQNKFIAEHPWFLEDARIDDGTLLQVATDGINFLLIEGSRWKNFVSPHDINNDGRTSVLDALTIINELSRGSFVDLDTNQLTPPSELSEWPGVYYDTNGDDRGTVLDALLVINEIARTGASSGEGELADVAIEQWSRDLTPISTAKPTSDPLTQNPNFPTRISTSSPEAENYISRPQVVDAEYESMGSESLKNLDESLLSLLAE
jgi:hypothetical protein